MVEARRSGGGPRPLDPVALFGRAAPSRTTPSTVSGARRQEPMRQTGYGPKPADLGCYPNRRNLNLPHAKSRPTGSTLAASRRVAGGGRRRCPQHRPHRLDRRSGPLARGHVRMAGVASRRGYSPRGHFEPTTHIDGSTHSSANPAAVTPAPRTNPARPTSADLVRDTASRSPTPIDAAAGNARAGLAPIGTGATVPRISDRHT